MTMALSIQGIRSLASRHGYQEIDLNEHSRVISFRGGPAKSTRVNVYYTTGTVGTCLNHPKSGKTQLFRRGVLTLNGLGAILENPRVHTGGGYYTRKHIRQKWKDTKNNQYLADSARRWLYVGAATGLVQNEEERNAITTICSKWDSLMWDPDSLPDMGKTRYQCGSQGGLFQMLLEVLHERCGDFQVLMATDVNHYHEQKNARKFVEKPEPRALPTCGNTCPKLQAFLEAHSDEVESLRRQFITSLGKETLMELALWLLSRSRKDHVFADFDIIPFQSKYNEAVHFAHVDYGILNYPKKPSMCAHCGVLLDV